MEHRVIDVEAGKFLIIKGPAYIKISHGEMEIFGSKLEGGADTYVVAGRQIPITVLRDSKLELRIGEGGDVREVGENPIPASWVEAYKELSTADNFKAVVLGDVDVGKSSFILYVANKLVSNGFKIGILDCDIGQSDIGPPGTIGLAIMDKTSHSYSDIKVFNAYFIGDKTPTGHLLPMVLGASELVEEAFENGVKGILINTTGFIYGGVARALKKYKLEAVKPTHIYALQHRHELKPLIKYLNMEGITRYVDVPKYIGRKEIGARKIFRRIKMNSYFRDVRRYIYSLKEIKIENTVITLGEKLKYIDDIVYKTIGRHMESTYLDRDSIYLIFKSSLDKSGYMKLMNVFKREFQDVKIISLDKIRGLYLGLFKDNIFRGIGILETVDFRGGRIIFKASRDLGDVNRIVFGYMILDDEYREKTRISPGYIG